jgi:hypothetical protein
LAQSRHDGLRTFEFAPVETNVVKRMLPPSDTAKEDRAGH